MSRTRMPGADAEARLPFGRFYREVFLPEHRQPLNVALHVLGTLLSGALLVAALGSGAWWWALAYPVVHAVPGLIGHRLLERNAAVGDLRVTRRDYPPHWFIAANHRLTWECLAGRREPAR